MPKKSSERQEYVSLWMNTAELAVRWGITRPAISKMIKRGNIPNEATMRLPSQRLSVSRKWVIEWEKNSKGISKEPRKAI